MDICHGSPNPLAERDIGRRRKMGRWGPTAGKLALTAAMLSGICAPVQATVPIRIAVRVVVSAGVDDALAAAVFRELVSTWRRADVDVLLYTEGLNPPPVAIVSLILSSEWSPAAGDGGLGWIRFVTDPDRDRGPAPVPVLMVSIAATRALVEATAYRGIPVVERPLALRRELLARALGRAAAHELGHYLMASPQHAAHGLMRARFRADDLLAQDAAAFRLDAADRRRLEARLRDAPFLLAERRD
jgi:hypothetical protein